MTILPKGGVLINIHTSLTVRVYNIHALQTLDNRIYVCMCVCVCVCLFVCLCLCLCLLILCVLMEWNLCIMRYDFHTLAQ